MIVINVDDPWPEWAGSRQSYKGYAIHAARLAPSWASNAGRLEVLCGELAANLYTDKKEDVSCGRCRRSLGLVP